MTILPMQGHALLFGAGKTHQPEPVYTNAGIMQNLINNHQLGF
jgi:hypothetical protein